MGFVSRLSLYFEEHFWDNVVTNVAFKNQIGYCLLYRNTTDKHIDDISSIVRSPIKKNNETNKEKKTMG